MNITKVATLQEIAKPAGVHSEVGSFKALLQEKREALKAATVDTTPTIVAATPNTTLKNVMTEAISSHENAAKSIKSFLTRTDYTPEKLLAIQYKTGVLFLREQMLCKTAELCANTLKSMTQMQV